MTLPDIDRALGRIEGHMENHRLTLALLQKNIRHLDTRLSKLEKGDRDHELELFDRQLKMAKNTRIHGQNVLAQEQNIAHMYHLYQHARPTGIQWIDVLSGTVRAIVTYTFFILYGVVKLSQVWLVIEAIDHLFLLQAINYVWHEEDQPLLATVMAFWFGQRGLKKQVQK